MAGTLRSWLHPRGSRLFRSAWLALSTCFREDHVSDEHVFCIAKKAAQVALGRSNSSRRASSASRHLS